MDSVGNARSRESQDGPIDASDLSTRHHPGGYSGRSDVTETRRRDRRQRLEVASAPMGLANWDGYASLRSLPGIGGAAEKLRPVALRLLRR